MLTMQSHIAMLTSQVNNLVMILTAGYHGCSFLPTVLEPASEETAIDACLTPAHSKVEKIVSPLERKFVLGAASAEEEDALLQQEAHELEEQNAEEENEHTQDIIRKKLNKFKKNAEQKQSQKETPTVLDRVTGLIGSSLRPETAAFWPFGPDQKSVQEESHNERVDFNFRSGDYVKLADLKNQKLNGEMGTVQQKLETGRLCVTLEGRKLNQKVCIKPENLVMVETGENIAAVARLRDNGRSVADLIADGYTISAIQRDGSDKVCIECCRPRYMCSCSFKFMASSASTRGGSVHIS